MRAQTQTQTQTALITGASAGIGAAYAKALAARGYDVVLVARRKTRLEELCAALERQFGVRAMAIAADLSEPAAAPRIFEELARKGLEIDFLVNNAGYGLPGRFTDSDWRAHRAFLEVMVVSYARLAHLALPSMQARGRGRILNVASLAGLVPGADGHTLYGASKAFLVSFTQSLAAENALAGITACAVCPGFTYSEFHDVNDTRSIVSRLPAYMWRTAEDVVEGSLKAIERGQVVYVPGAWNKFVAGLMRLLPRSWAAQLVRRSSVKFRRAAAADHRDDAPKASPASTSSTRE